MASSLMDGVGKVVVGVWRAHTALDESDEADCSPEAPDRFRKLRSSSSLNSLRMSLRKRMPLRAVQTNSLPENPTWENTKEQPKPSAVRKMTRSARNSITEVCQVHGMVALRLSLFHGIIVERCIIVYSHCLPLPAVHRGCKGTKSLHVGNAWLRLLVGRASVKKLVHPPPAPLNAHLVAQ